MSDRSCPSADSNHRTSIARSAIRGSRQYEPNASNRSSLEISFTHLIHHLRTPTGPVHLSGNIYVIIPGSRGALDPARIQLTLDPVSRCGSRTRPLHRYPY